MPAASRVGRARSGFSIFEQIFALADRRMTGTNSSAGGAVESWIRRSAAKKATRLRASEAAREEERSKNCSSARCQCASHARASYPKRSGHQAGARAWT